MIKFKSIREEKEFHELPVHNSRLANLLRALDYFTTLEFGKDVTITSVYRTAQEHQKLYADTPIAERPITSPHMFYEAVDIRSSDFTTPQIERMLSFLNQFTFRNGKKVALYHTVSGNAFHFHIQYGKDRVL